MAKIIKTCDSSYWQGFGTRANTPKLLEGVKTFTATMESNILLWNVGNRSTS